MDSRLDGRRDFLLVFERGEPSDAVLDDLDLLPVDFRRRENDKTPKDVEPVKPQVNRPQ